MLAAVAPRFPADVAPALASNDNGRASWRREAPRATGDAFWYVVRAASGGRLRVDCLAVGALKVAGAGLA